MAELFPTDPKRIRERIRRYERALKRELEAGYSGDGYGKGGVARLVENRKAGVSSWL